MKTPENRPNKRPRKNNKEVASAPTVPVTPIAPVPTAPQEQPAPPTVKSVVPVNGVIEIDAAMMQELFEKASNIKSQKIKKYVSDQKDAEALRSVIQEYFTSFILVGYSVDNKRLIIKSTTSDKDEDALLEELRYVCFKLSGG